MFRNLVQPIKFILLLILTLYPS